MKFSEYIKIIYVKLLWWTWTKTFSGWLRTCKSLFEKSAPVDSSTLFYLLIPRSLSRFRKLSTQSKKISSNRHKSKLKRKRNVRHPVLSIYRRFGNSSVSFFHTCFPINFSQIPIIFPRLFVESLRAIIFKLSGLSIEIYSCALRFSLLSLNRK